MGNVRLSQEVLTEGGNQNIIPVDAEITKLLQKKARRNAVVGGPIRWNTIIWNWLHQCFFYLSLTDMSFKVFLEANLFVLCFGIMSIFRLSILINTVISFFMAQTLNWIFNGNFWACLLSAFPSRRNKGAAQTQAYVNAMAARLSANDAVDAMMLLGSVCRSQWHSRSDIDVRILRKRGLRSAIYASWLTLKERLIAVVQGQPLEIYLADSVAFLAKKRSDEVPIFLICKVPDSIPFAFKLLPELPELTASVQRN
jgi:predicted nucleotidyltransferase